MKKERAIKPDGRYLLYYSFEPSELHRPGIRPRPRRAARVRRKRNGKL